MQNRVQACVSGTPKLGHARPAARMQMMGLALLASLLAGCGTVSGLTGGNSAASPASATLPPPRPADPLAAFAAAARPGQQSMVSPSAGAAPVPVRLVRSYFAASGRPCRELALGVSGVQRSALYCEEPGGWEAAQPLLRGGAVARP